MNWITLENGKRILISQKKSSKKLSKKNYAIVCGIINTYPKKFKKGINTQIVDDKIVIFNYRGSNDFDIVGVGKYEN